MGRESVTNPPVDFEQPASDDGSAFEYRFTDEPVVEAVLSAVGAVTDERAFPDAPTSTDGGRDSLPPLYEAIDPDALERTFSGEPSDGVTVTFPYAGCKVTVTGGDAVLVREGASSNPGD